MSSVLTVCSVHLQWTGKGTYSVRWMFTVHCCLDLKRALHVHRVSLSSLTVYTVSALSSALYTYNVCTLRVHSVLVMALTVYTTCAVYLITPCVLVQCIMHFPNTQGGSNCTFGALYAHIQWTACAPIAHEVQRYA